MKKRININKDILSFIIINVLLLILLIVLIILTKNIIYLLSCIIIILLINAFNIYRIYLTKYNNKNNSIYAIIKEIYLITNINKSITEDEYNGSILIKELLSDINADKTFEPYKKLISKINNKEIGQLLLYVYLYNTTNKKQYLNEFNKEYQIIINKYKTIKEKEYKYKTSLIMFIPLVSNVLIIISIISICLLNIWG